MKYLTQYLPDTDVELILVEINGIRSEAVRITKNATLMLLHAVTKNDFYLDETICFSKMS